MKRLHNTSKWGVKGIKVDFMQRDDQWMVNYYYEVAAKDGRAQDAGRFSRRLQARRDGAHLAQCDHP
ncbi:MAG: glycoside hydrolase family 97 catalytic domain-containing protein [Marinilabiliales bacterium]|nr:glycoside hydrolase family 97 catalytic domain-containing protein [Marinilabiliales bacterium]